MALQALPTMPLFDASMDLSIDGRVAGFSILLILATSLLFGLVPALRSAREDVAGQLREDRRTSSVGRSTMRFRNGLVVVQVAGSLVLIVVAGLFGRSLLAMQNSDTGVDPDRVAFVYTSFSQAGLAGPAAAAALGEVLARVSTLPGVTRVAAASRLPAQRSGTTTTIVEGYTPTAGTDAVELGYTGITPDYFRTVGLAVLEGRAFDGTDTLANGRVGILNQAAATRFWGGEPAAGRRLRSQSQPDLIRTIIGVAGNAPVAGFPEPSTPSMFYLPMTQMNFGSAYILARTDGDAEVLARVMRSAVTDVRASLEVTQSGTLSSHFGESLLQRRFMVGLMGAVSALSLLLAALGVYAVVAFNVARRAGEFGIRVALGAAPGRVAQLVVRETLRVVAVGVAVGLVLAAALASQLSALLFGISAFDPITLSGAVLFLSATAVLAAYVPARRAAHLDPSHALRAS
jgi:predicted permease